MKRRIFKFLVFFIILFHLYFKNETYPEICDWFLLNLGYDTTYSEIYDWVSLKWRFIYDWVSLNLGFIEEVAVAPVPEVVKISESVLEPKTYVCNWKKELAYIGVGVSLGVIVTVATGGVGSMTFLAACPLIKAGAICYFVL